VGENFGETYSAGDSNRVRRLPQRNVNVKPKKQEAYARHNVVDQKNELRGMRYSSNRRKKGSSRPTSSNSFPPNQGAILHSTNDTDMKGWQCKIAQQNHNRPPCPPPRKTRAAAGGVSRSEVAVKITKLQLPESTRHPSAGKCLLRLKSYLVLPTRGALPYVLSLEAPSVARGVDKVDRQRTKSQSKQIANKSVAATEPQAMESGAESACHTRGKLVA
jgi:hypothetical protein